MNNSINIFGAPARQENDLDIFSSPQVSQSVDIFSNNARGPSNNGSPVDIFSAPTASEVNIFAAETPTTDIFSESVDIFSSSVDIFSDETSSEVNIFGDSSEESITSKFESLVSDLEDEDLDVLANLVSIAFEIYQDGV